MTALPTAIENSPLHSTQDIQERPAPRQAQNENDIIVLRTSAKCIIYATFQHAESIGLQGYAPMKNDSVQTNLHISGTRLTSVSFMRHNRSLAIGGDG